MDSCPKCSSRNFRKDGIVKSRQRYFCKDCKRHFTVEQVGKSNKLKRSCGKKVEPISIWNWIQLFQILIVKIKNQPPCLVTRFLLKPTPPGVDDKVQNIILT